MSEWYGYTPTPRYTLTIVYNFYSSPSSETLGNYGLYYSYGTGADTLLTTLDVGSDCATNFNSAGIPSGSNVYFGVKNAGKAQTPIQFDVNTITCPNTYNLSYCGTYDTRYGQDPGPYSFTINGDIKFYVTIAAVKGFFTSC